MVDYHNGCFLKLILEFLSRSYVLAVIRKRQLKPPMGLNYAFLKSTGVKEVSFLNEA